MKTTQAKKSKPDRKTGVTAHNKTEDVLAVLRDATSSKEYYLSVIDSFPMDGREYVVMYNYEPDDGNHADPELVIMRTEFARAGDQYFYSIKDSRELDRAFNRFMMRFSTSPGGYPGK